VWTWLRGHPTHQVFEPCDPLPWADDTEPHRYLLHPILSPEHVGPIGGICLVQEGSYALDRPVDLQPALQALAAQVASTLRSADDYRKTLDHQKMAQELAFAGQIQASFLPTDLPSLDGWQVAAALQAARETSGDFYDVFPLPNGKLGLLVADVSDKGMGAALYMAVARTLLRTYAHEYHTRPDYVLRVANRRILADTQAGLFVSVFYAVVDPYSGTLSYASAGHCPAFLLRLNQDQPEMLRRTGMVLGVMEGGAWQQESVAMEPGDALVLYSDGVTDAQNAGAEFFGEERLHATICAHKGDPASQLQEAILAAVHQFTGDTSRFDDITVLVLERQPPASSRSTPIA
jgi:sigma-B regulation protein RsbU (phosphoserine phosphatase)